MNDNPLRTLDHLSPPNQWDDITGRAEDGPLIDIVPVVGERHTSGRWVLTAAAVIALAVGGLAVASNGDRAPKDLAAASSIVADPSMPATGTGDPTSGGTTPTTTTTTTPSGRLVTWEGQLVDGRTYQVEVDDDVVSAYVDGEEVNPAVDTEVPRYSGGASMVGFELTPNPNAGPKDWVIVGARPTGAVETFVEGPDGEVELPSLTISPDGRFYALHALELDFMNDPTTPWPVRHRDAAGTVIGLP